MLVDRDGYEVYDLNGKKDEEFKVGATTTTADLIGARFHDRRALCQLHRRAFAPARSFNAPVSVGNVSVTMLQLSNIAWEVNRELALGSRRTHRFRAMPEAMKCWDREYETGWAPHI